MRSEDKDIENSDCFRLDKNQISAFIFPALSVCYSFIVSEIPLSTEP